MAFQLDITLIFKCLKYYFSMCYLELLIEKDFYNPFCLFPLISDSYWVTAKLAFVVTGKVSLAGPTRDKSTKEESLHRKDIVKVQHVIFVIICIGSNSFIIILCVCWQSIYEKVLHLSRLRERLI